MQEIDKYSVGALLYCPALNANLAENIMTAKWPTPYSIAICLEDTIADDAVEQAEKTMLETLDTLQEARRKKYFYMPKVFIRVRSANHLRSLCYADKNIQGDGDIVKGFILPKYNAQTGLFYNNAFKQVTKHFDTPICAMPILESRDFFSLSERTHLLAETHELIDAIKEYVLNVRVGGNDMCNVYGLRRHNDETIYDVRVIADLLCDILTECSEDYVVSGAVWEYFAGEDEQWSKGLQAELKLDRLNGFIGKTVIHPNQIKYVNQSLKVPQQDYNDAVSLLKLNDNKELLVDKGAEGERMNEAKTHMNWANKILQLASIYGVKKGYY